MNTFLHFSFKYPRSRRFVIVGDLENVGSIYIIVVPPAHDMVGIHVEFKNRYLVR